MNDERLEQLLDRYFDEALRAGERVELEQELRGSSSARELFWRRARFHGLLRQWGHQSVGGQEAGTARIRWRAPVALKLALAASVVLLAALAALLMFRMGDSGATLADVQGGVRVVRDSREVAASAGFVLKSGDRVLTGTNGSGVLAFAGEPTQISAGPDSELTLLAMRPAKHFRLVAGGLRADVAPQPSGHPLVVRTPHAAATVVGTEFELAVAAAQTRLEVREGSVRLAGADVPGIADVGAGQFAVATTTQAPRARQQTSAAAFLNSMWSQGRATSAGPVRLRNFPLRTEDIGTIIPMGLTASGHVTPSDHLYLVPRDTSDRSRRYDVVAMADGFVVNIQWRPKGNPDPTVFDREVDLKIVVEHSATCWSYVDHVAGLATNLQAQVGTALRPGQPIQVRVAVKAGQVIGHIGAHTFDFALIDTTVTRTNFVRPDRFLDRDPWKLHTVDPFNYVVEPLRGELLQRNPRQTPPVGGRMDCDVDGTLAGNWYREGSGGYAGLNRRLDYWEGHVAFVPHHVHPTNVVVSIGLYEGQPRQFWVKRNAPDPATVRESAGMVKYELLWGRLGSSGQSQVRQDADVVQATAMAQLLPGRRLKFEIFPGKAAADVKGFTANARFYER